MGTNSAYQRELRERLLSLALETHKHSHRQVGSFSSVSTGGSYVEVFTQDDVLETTKAYEAYVTGESESTS